MPSKLNDLFMFLITFMCIYSFIACDLIYSLIFLCLKCLMVLNWSIFQVNIRDICMCYIFLGMAVCYCFKYKKKCKKINLYILYIERKKEEPSMFLSVFLVVVMEKNPNFWDK